MTAKRDGWYLKYIVRNARGQIVESVWMPLKASNYDEASVCESQILGDLFAEHRAGGDVLQTTDICLMEYRNGKQVFCEKAGTGMEESAW